MLEQRHERRLLITLQLKWTGRGRQPETAETGDLSASGCFILSCARPEVGETLWLSLQASKTTWLHLRGDVVYLMEVGFGVRFLALTPEAEATLAQLITDYHEAAAQTPLVEAIWAAELTARLESPVRSVE
ncbi:MAG: PilZ domain-containing protein [Pyrinomonadaceae bacterium]